MKPRRFGLPPVIGWTSCPWCGNFVEQRLGRARIYCDTVCATALRRARKREEEMWTPDMTKT